MKLNKLTLIILSSAAVVIILLLILNTIGSNKIGFLPINNSGQILSIDKSIFYVGSGQLIKRPIRGSEYEIQILGTDIVYALASRDKSKIYYYKNDNSKMKAYIFDIKNNTTKEYKMYDFFFWQNNSGKFVTTNGDSSVIYSESLNIDYTQVPYNSFSSYAGIILGSLVTETPENPFLSWDVVNKASAKFKTLEIESFQEDTFPWVVGDFMLYNDLDDNLVIINKEGVQTNTKLGITESQITSSDSDDQFFYSIKGDEMTISSIKLSNSRVEKVKTLNLASALKQNNLKASDISQIYYADGALYIQIDGRIMDIQL